MEESPDIIFDITSLKIIETKPSDALQRMYKMLDKKIVEYDEKERDIARVNWKFIVSRIERSAREKLLPYGCDKISKPYFSKDYPVIFFEKTNSPYEIYALTWYFGKNVYLLIADYKLRHNLTIEEVDDKFYQTSTQYNDPNILFHFAKISNDYVTKSMWDYYDRDMAKFDSGFLMNLSEVIEFIRVKPLKRA